MREKFLLCRPQGGLNDMLCQVECCCSYAEHTGRTVIVDTNYRNSDHFRDSFDRYFAPRYSKLLLSIDDVAEPLEQLSVFPEFLARRLNDYRSFWSRELTCDCDEATHQPLGFDFSRDYPHELLVHHSAGGGQNSLFALLRLTLRKALVDELSGRLARLGRPYTGVHVRHTDYQSDYRGLLSRLAQSTGKVFLATDNRRVLDDFAVALGADRVVSFAALPLQYDAPLHQLRLTPSDTYRRNLDAILDLLLLALSDTLSTVELSNAGHVKYSGFTMLARNLWSARIVLKYLIDSTDIRFGLD
jgi:hypothetical protein